MKHLLLTLIAMSGLIVTTACGTPAEKAASALAGRIAPGYSFRFREIPDSVERYSFYTSGGHLVVEGSTVSALAVGLNRYLKDFCNVTVSWYDDESIALPETMPQVPQPVSGKSLVPERFFLNYCTFGYTMPWWGWKQWQHFIDWMSLQGVNLPLAITGEDAVWQEVWRQHGLTDDEIRAWFTGPAYLPWHRMCNIDGVDGPLPQGWIDGQKKLQKRIVKRERELGMKPILPAFAGHIPGLLKEKYPEARITDVARWCRFPEENHCYFLSPEDTLYGIIQQEFLLAQSRLYGTDHIYGFDLFNEVPPPSWEPEMLARIGRGAFASVEAVDPQAQWVQMGWLFYNDSRHWTPENIKAYLEAVPKGRVTILDYYTENVPVWKLTEAFYGQPYIFCYLGNFGGNTRLSGPFRKESERIGEVLAKGGSNLRGIGCTLEGFGLNQWFYEYVMERAWEGIPDDEWLSSLDRRHGSPEGFWKAMADSIYLRGSFSEGALVCGRPCESGHHHWTVVNHTPYQNATLVRQWRRLVAAPSEMATWKADALALGSQALGNHFAVLRDQFVAACKAEDLAEAEILAGKMRALLDDIATLTACDPNSRLDSWLRDAATWAINDEQKTYYLHDAWQLLTIWGDTPTLNDYASRLWSGLIDSYYTPRWELFIREELRCLKEGQVFDQKAFDEKCRTLELSLSAQAPEGPDRPAANVAPLCRELLRKWFPEEVTLVSYNVGAFGKYDGSGIPGIAGFIESSGAGFAALQETDSCNRRHNSFQVEQLARELGGWEYHFASAFPFAGGAYGNGVVTREPVMARHSVALPQEDGSEPRSAAVVETPQCVFASVHLEYSSQEAALAQARVLNDWFSEHYAGSGKPVILCGDMNAQPGSPVIEELSRVWEQLSGTDFTFSTRRPHECIDYFFALKTAVPVEVVSYEVPTAGLEELSDHFPVVMKLAF